MLVDYVGLFAPLTSKGGWRWDPATHKLSMSNPGEATLTPWSHAPCPIPGMKERGFDCGLMHMMFGYLFENKSVPIFCQDCYKVVVGPETLEQVKKISYWQHSECAPNGWACKTGAERRPYTFRRWGAYFYCRGLEEGRERYKAVREWVDENLGEDIKVYLKRACTEFEQALGDSDKWENTELQEEIEKEFFEEIIDYGGLLGSQSEIVRHHVWNVWEDWERTTRDPVTYHEEPEPEGE